MQIKTITFFSNYYNHHQKALCDAFYAMLGDGFTFVETMPIEGFRAQMGWGEDNPSYVLRTYESTENDEKAKDLGLNSDLVIMGTAPEVYIEPRLSENKLTFRYSERPLKEGFIKFFIPRLTRKYLHLHVRNRKKNIHILGASAFTSLDYHKMFRSYEGKCYKFGYFPIHCEYDTKELMEKKAELAAGRPSILWMGRMLKLKRPDLVVKACANLRDMGYDFTLALVGEGEEEEHLKSLVKELKLTDRVTISGFLKPQEARDRMAQAQIYVMTSNKLEGWGSVIYEGLNAGCAVVASHACGATPWLVKHEQCGLVYKSGSVQSLTNQLEKLLKNPELVTEYGTKAYEQMHAMWNPAVAAERVIGLAEALSEGKEVPYEDGPCSRAPFLKNNWFKEV